MLTYILLFSLIAIIILGVIRASKHHRPGARPQREPFVGAGAPSRNDMADEIEAVGKPRVIGYNPEWSPKFARKDKNPAEGLTKRVTIKEPIHSNITPAHITKTPPLFSTKAETVKRPAPETSGQAVTDLIVINIIAEPLRPYRGYELLQALLAVGLRYGKWDIFHRHQEANGHGPVLFSLASINKPGTFDLAKMGSFSTQGLALFTRTSNLEAPLIALETLLKAAHQLTAELGGVICDEQRIPLDANKVAEWYSRIGAPAEVVE